MLKTRFCPNTHAGICQCADGNLFRHQRRQFFYSFIYFFYHNQLCRVQLRFQCHVYLCQHVLFQCQCENPDKLHDTVRNCRCDDLGQRLKLQQNVSHKFITLTQHFNKEGIFMCVCVCLPTWSKSVYQVSVSTLPVKSLDTTYDLNVVPVIVLTIDTAVSQWRHQNHKVLPHTWNYVRNFKIVK